jgi:hypothetical protein
MILLIGTSAAPLEARPAETLLLNGIPHVRNPAQPLRGTRTLHLEEQWRAGGEENEILFGVIADVVSDSLGRLYLLDRQLCQIFVFSPDGELQRTLSRAGEGPGEIQQPTDILFMPGGLLGVIHRARGQIVQMDLAGTPQSSYHLLDAHGLTAGSIRLRNAAWRGGTLVLCGEDWKAADGAMQRQRFLGIFDRDGTETARVLTRGTGADFGRREFIERDDYFVDRGGWAVGPDGFLYMAPERNRYVVHVHAPDGGLLRVIERDYTPQQRTAAEKEAVASGVSMMIDGERVAVDAEIEDHEPCIVRIDIDDRGRLWIQDGNSTSDLPAGVMLACDVFAPSGEYLERVQIACKGEADRDRLYVLPENRFVLLRNIRAAYASLFGGRDSAEEGDAVAPLEVVYFRQEEVVGGETLR